MKANLEKRAVLIRDVPESVHRKLRVESALRGISVQKRVIEILREATAQTNLHNIEAEANPLKAGSTTT